MPKRLKGWITPNNTELEQFEDCARVKLHNTYVFVLDYYENTVKLNSGGFRTVTTKRRINESCRAFNSPFQVFQKDWEWYVDAYNGIVIPFEDGMTLPRTYEAYAVRRLSDERG